ncbi:MAG: hypothetical protein ACREJ9_14900 [Candidatus Rokuibacteriota bacterium]
MTLLPLLILALAASLAAAESLDVSTEAYREAAARGEVGALSGRAMIENPRPGADPRPATEVGVTLVPRSERLLDQLRSIRERARRELDVYRDSALAVAEARQALERALWRAGAAELVRFTAVDPDGRFAFEALPAGNWLLIAQRAVFVPKGSPAVSKRDRETFASRPRFTGYYAVTIWVRELTVAPGQWTELELTDRNVWMTALAEERAKNAGR